MFNLARNYHLEYHIDAFHANNNYLELIFPTIRIPRFAKNVFNSSRDYYVKENPTIMNGTRLIYNGVTAD